MFHAEQKHGLCVQCVRDFALDFAGAWWLGGVHNYRRFGVRFEPKAAE